MVDLRREDPLRKGTYETIYAQFTVDRPDLWSRVGPRNYVELNPSIRSGHILKIHRRMKVETDFEYFL